MSKMGCSIVKPLSKVSGAVALSTRFFTLACRLVEDLTKFFWSSFLVLTASSYPCMVFQQVSRKLHLPQIIAEDISIVEIVDPLRSC